MSLHRPSCQSLTLLGCCWLLACASHGTSTQQSTELAGSSGRDAGPNALLPQAGATAGAAATAGTGAENTAPSRQVDAAHDSGTALAADGGADAGPGLLADAAAGPGVGTDAAVERPKPRCLTKGSQVVLIGDSYISWVSHTFPSDLNREAGQTFRMYAVGGYSMGSGGIGFIPPQLDQAIADDPDILTAVMDGGGNDVLVPDTNQFPRGGDCKMSDMSPTIPDCQKIVDKAIAAADKMMSNAIAHQLTDVVYFFYPNVPEGTLIGGTHPNAILEYAFPRVKDFCDGSYQRNGGKLSCHFVDLRPVFKGHPEYFAPTDIHPNSTGSAAMAKVIWQTMKDNCLAQPQSSGCCQP